MDSLYFFLRFSPDWQGGDSIQTGVERNGGFDHLFEVGPPGRPAEIRDEEWPN
jgi:hypothetical protein